MAVKVITVPKGTFSPIPDKDLEARMEIGVCEFEYVCQTDKASGGKGSYRSAIGTRNLSMSFVPFSDIPYGGRVVPAHVCTYWDLDRLAWRCFDRFALIDYSEDIFVET